MTWDYLGIINMNVLKMTLLIILKTSEVSGCRMS